MTGFPTLFQTNDRSLETLRTLRPRWLAYKDVISRNIRHFVNATRVPNIWTLRRHLATELASEIDFCKLDGELPDIEILTKFGRCLIFRPDVSCCVERILRGDMHLTPAADIILEAVNAAGWTETFWSTAHDLPEEEPKDWIRAVRFTGEALAGIATVAITDLQNEDIVSFESAERIMKLTEFSPQRGIKLAHTLRSSDYKGVKRAFEKNHFLRLLLIAAQEGEWCGPTPPICLPPVLNYYISRDDLADKACAALQQALDSRDQQWLVISGAAGAGKSCLATDLAHRYLAAQPVWLSFGCRDEGEIYTEARATILDSFPNADRTLMNSKTLIAKALTREATKNTILFLDNVWRPEHLLPFVEAKVVVITSRMSISYRNVRIEIIPVEASLSQKQSLSIFDKIVEREVSHLCGFDDLTRILHFIHYNPLATSVLASFVKMHQNEGDNSFLYDTLKRIENDKENEFESISLTLQSSGHDYRESGHTDVNIYSILSICVDDLKDTPLWDAYFSLIVFPRGSLITKTVFEKLEFRAQYLNIFCNRSLLQLQGNEGFVMHDLFFEVIDSRLRRDLDKRKSIFRRLVEAYEIGNRIDPGDDFFFINIINSCLEAGEIDIALKYLKSPTYLLNRFCKLKFTNLFRDFDKVLLIRDNEIARVARNFINHPELWKNFEDRKSILRQAVLFSRDKAFDSDLLALAKEEAKLPLYRVEVQIHKRIFIRFEETARIEVTDPILDMALSADENAALLVTEKDIILFIPHLTILRRYPFKERVVCCAPAQNNQWLLVTKTSCVVIDDNLTEIHRWRPGWTFHEVAISKDSSCVVVWTSGKPLYRFQPQGEEIKEVKNSVFEDREVYGLAASKNLVVAVCCAPERTTQIFVWNIDKEEMVNYSINETFEKHVTCSLGDQLLIIFCRRKQFMLKLESGAWHTKDRRGIEVKTNDEKFSVRHLLFRMYRLPLLCFQIRFGIFPESVAQNPSEYIYRLLSLPVGSMLSFIVSTEPKEAALFRPNSRIITHPTPEFHSKCFKAIWLPKLKEFALFLIENEQVIVRATDEGRLKIFRFKSVNLWNAKVTVRGDRAIVWMKGDRLLVEVSLQKSPCGWFTRFLGAWPSHEHCFEDDISEVAVSATILAVVDRKGKIHLHNGSEWRILTQVIEEKKELFAFSDAVGILLKNSRTFLIYDFNDNKRFEKVQVVSADISLCGKRAALVLENGTIIEVSQRGEKKRQFEFPDCMCVRYLFHALIAWTSSGRAALFSDGPQMILNFPEHVLSVKKTTEGSLAVLRTTWQLWLLDLSSGQRELLFDWCCAGSYPIEHFYMNSDATSFVIVDSLKRFSTIHRLETLET